MSAVSYVLRWTGWILLLVPFGAGMTVTALSVKKMMALNDSEIEDCNSKIKRTLYASMVLTTMVGFVHLVKNFFI